MVGPNGMGNGVPERIKVTGTIQVIQAEDATIIIVGGSSLCDQLWTGSTCSLVCGRRCSSQRVIACISCICCVWTKGFLAWTSCISLLFQLQELLLLVGIRTATTALGGRRTLRGRGNFRQKICLDDALGKQCLGIQSFSERL